MTTCWTADRGWTSCVQAVGFWSAPAWARAGIQTKIPRAHSFFMESPGSRARGYTGRAEQGTCGEKSEDISYQDCQGQRGISGGPVTEGLQGELGHSAVVEVAGLVELAALDPEH